MDGMTIDEVIKYFYDDAKENEKLAIIYRGNDDDMAEMHKQDAIRSSYVAEWLRELKAYQKAYEEIRKLPIVWEFGEGVIRCLTIIEDCLEEVNTDE